MQTLSLIAHYKCKGRLNVCNLLREIAARLDSREKWDVKQFAKLHSNFLWLFFFKFCGWKLKKVNIGHQLYKGDPLKSWNFFIFQISKCTYYRQANRYLHHNNEGENAWQHTHTYPPYIVPIYICGIPYGTLCSFTFTEFFAFLAMYI